jgi:hypothetical protein
VREVPHRIRAILAVAPDARTEAQRSDLATHFRPLAPSLASLNEELAKKKKELADAKPVDLPIMRELPADKRRVTHLMLKGNFLNPGEKVEPALPAAFSGLGDQRPTTNDQRSTGSGRQRLASLAPSPRRPVAPSPPDRLAVARWLVSRDNPLTARVAVNRFWAQLFGTGIVETEEDFGTQGALPTHPELLDWLAVEFMERGWDVKALLKTIVMSATYRQSSRVTPAMREKDPRNRLLARYPRRRLDAETVRDQALALSGLLSRKIGGPSVYPPQPEGLWRAAFNGQRTWPTSTGEDRYRRGLYTFWRRTVPYPSMATFDAPSRETCTVRRTPTNTPLQALVTMNDPVYVEIAQALARRIVREAGPPAAGGTTVPERARYGLRLALARAPQEAQVRALISLYQTELAHYRRDPEAAKKLATDPLGPLPDGLDAAEMAAWTVVANVLLNLDGVLAKG